MFQPSPDFLCSPVPGCSQSLKPCPLCYKLPYFRAGQSLGERALAPGVSGSALGIEELPKPVKSGWVQNTLNQKWKMAQWDSKRKPCSLANSWPTAGQGDRTERLMEHWDFFSRCSHQGYMARLRLFLPPLYNARSKMYDSMTRVNLLFVLNLWEPSALAGTWTSLVFKWVCIPGWTFSQLWLEQSYKIMTCWK